MVSVSEGSMRKHEETEKMICVVIAQLCRSTKDLDDMKQQSTAGLGPKHLPTSLRNFLPKELKAVRDRKSVCSSDLCDYQFYKGVFRWFWLGFFVVCISLNCNHFFVHVTLRYHITAQVDFPRPEEEYQDINMNSKISKSLS